MQHSQRRRGGPKGNFLFLVLWLGGGASFLQSQTFDSGSTGADGALNLTTPGTVIFDPAALNLRPAVENVFHFTTINIGPGVTVRFTTKSFNHPVYWLAQGAVTINGTLNLDGENGLGEEAPGILTLYPAAGGSGGFNGGLPGQPGSGPNGGTPTVADQNAKQTPNRYLIPLVGGSGGAGLPSNGGTGGGGGGAIYIASSTSITFGGGILARGAPGGRVGGGGGGAIRLMAPNVVQGCTNFAGCTAPHGDRHCADGGALQAGGAAIGVVRIDANTTQIPTPQCISPAPVFSKVLRSVFPTTPPSKISVVSLVVNGTTIPVNANPFNPPDAVFNTQSPVTVNVQAQYIPVGTVPRILLFSETGVAQTINCSPLAGTLQASTCSASVNFATGITQGSVKATWP